jgi:hypothetical protein
MTVGMRGSFGDGSPRITIHFCGIQQFTPFLPKTIQHPFRSQKRFPRKGQALS